MTDETKMRYSFLSKFHTFWTMGKSAGNLTFKEIFSQNQYSPFVSLLFGTVILLYWLNLNTKYQVDFSIFNIK